MLKSHKKTIIEALGRHPIHPFPARMAPGIALDALSESKGCLSVLDPMMGSGTVLAVAKASGHKAIGSDLDPLAVLLSKVWTTPVDRKRATDAAVRALEHARVVAAKLAQRDAYPSSADEQTKKFVRYWFDPYARRQLASLARAISRVKDRSVQDVLWCGFSRLIITKSAGASLAMDLSHSRPHRSYQTAPLKPFAKFMAAVETVISNCPKKSHKNGPYASVRHGDARDLPISDGSIDLVLSSPPYLNAIDYLRCSKFSLVWMGYGVDEIRRIRSGSVGTEAPSEACQHQPLVRAVIRSLRLAPALSRRNRATLAQYVWDMYRVTAEAARVLKPGGRAVYVVGDSTIRGTFVRNSSIVAAVARRNGLTLVSRSSRKLPENRRYLPPPRKRNRAKLDARMRREVILVLRK
ncbi:MAG TPA: hypothetical protein VGM17_06330 [Rhizomicrobium sp.]|jgi:DNA modification methylase